MKLASLLQLVDKLQQAGKTDNLQQVCDVFGCVGITDQSEFYIYLLDKLIPTAQDVQQTQLLHPKLKL